MGGTPSSRQDIGERVKCNFAQAIIDAARVSNVDVVGFVCKTSDDASAHARFYLPLVNAVTGRTFDGKPADVEEWVPKMQQYTKVLDRALQRLQDTPLTLVLLSIYSENEAIYPPP